MVVAVKAGDCFSAYLFSGVTGPSASGAFDTNKSGILVGGGPNVGCDGRNVPTISHVSVFTAGGGGGSGGGGGGGGPDPIPLPAAGWMMLAGIAGLAAARRRKA